MSTLAAVQDTSPKLNIETPGHAKETLSKESEQIQQGKDRPITLPLQGERESPNIQMKSESFTNESGAKPPSSDPHAVQRDGVSKVVDKDTTSTSVVHDIPVTYDKDAPKHSAESISSAFSTPPREPSVSHVSGSADSAHITAEDSDVPHTLTESGNMPTEKQSAPHTMTEERSSPHTVAEEPSASHIPTEKPSSPQIPAEKSGAPQIPAEKSGAPQIPAEKSSAPQIPAKSSAPQIPAEKSSAPQIPAEKSSAPQNPAEKSGAPRNPTDETTAPHITEEKSSAPQIPKEKSSAPPIPTEKPGAPHTPNEKLKSPHIPAEQSSAPHAPSSTEVPLTSVPKAASQPVHGADITVDKPRFSEVNEMSHTEYSDGINVKPSVSQASSKEPVGGIKPDTYVNGQQNKVEGSQKAQAPDLATQSAGKVPKEASVLDGKSELRQSETVDSASRTSASKQKKVTYCLPFLQSVLWLC
jgi:hypothetical protein